MKKSEKRPYLKTAGPASVKKFPLFLLSYSDPEMHFSHKKAFTFALLFIGKMMP